MTSVSLSDSGYFIKQVLHGVLCSEAHKNVFKKKLQGTNSLTGPGDGKEATKSGTGAATQHDHNDDSAQS